MARLDRLPGGQKLGAGDEPVGVVIPSELGQGLLVGPELVRERGEILVATGGRPPGLGEASNRARNPSPAVFTSRPRWAASTVRIASWWRARSDARAASPSSRRRSSSSRCR